MPMSPGLFGLGLVGGQSGGAAGPSTPGIIAASRAGAPEILSAAYTSGLAPPYTWRTEHYAHPQGDISNLQFVDIGWGFASTLATARGSNATIKRYVEYPADTFTQVTWSGSSSVVVPDGGVTKSDKCPVTIPAGALWWERVVLTAVDGTAKMQLYNNPNKVTGTATNAEIGLTNGQAVGDFGNSGTIAPTSAATNYYSAAFILGDVAAKNARSFLIFGDSISVNGTGDYQTPSPKHGVGWAQRLLDDKFAWNKIGRAGMSTIDLRQATPLGFFTALLPYISGAYTDALFCWGRNDVGTRTAAQIVLDITAIAALLPAGVKKHITTVTPAPTSTDDWATVANQTAETTNFTKINDYNNQVRAGLSFVNGQVIDIADIVETARDSGIWQTPPKPIIETTGGGVHPTSDRAASIAAAITILP